MLTDFKDTTFGEMQQGQTAATTETVAPNQNETTTVDAAIAPLVEPVAAAATTTDAATADAPLATTATGDNTVEFELPAFAVEQTDTTQQQQQPAAPSWKEAIRSADRSELLKELGFTDFEIGLNDYIQKGGNPESFLQAKAVDWNKVSDADLLKTGLKDEFPDATDAQIERLFNKRYSQHELAEDEDKEDGMLMIKSEARKIRAHRLEQQSKLPVIPPQPTPPAPPEPTIPPEVEKYGTAIAQSKVFQDARTSKRVAVTLPDGKPIHFDISQPDLLMHSIFNPEFQRKLNMTQQGEPDVQIVAEKALFNLNPSFVKKALYNAGYEAAKAAIIAEHQNAGLPKQVAAGSDAVPFKQVWGQAKVSTYGGG